MFFLGLAKFIHQDNLFLVCKHLLIQAKVNFTDSYLTAKVKKHIDYPSLLTVKETLEEYGVKTLAVRKGSFSYADFETPFICTIQREGWSNPNFIVVDAIDGDKINFVDPEINKAVELSIDEFNEIDTGVALLIDFDAAKDEENYKINLQNERRGIFTKSIPILLLTSTVLWSVIYQFKDGFSWPTLIEVVFILTSFIGLIISFLLLVREVDNHNPFVNEVCGILGKKSNCKAVLSSNQAKFFGISWSSWGFTYFTTFFLSMIFFAKQPSNLYFWSTISSLISPYILFSIYYQWRIIKQWCPLCLAVQFLLIINLFCGIFFFKSSMSAISTYDYYLVFVLCFLSAAIFMGVYFLIPMFQLSNDSHQFEMRWKRLRYNSVVFNSLLNQSEKLSISADGLGLIIGNPMATDEIIKVCNPYCRPCSRAHLELEELIKKNMNLRVRIIFTATGADDDQRSAPVRHLLAIEERDGTQILHQALDDWYLSDEKNYDDFSLKYPMNGELKTQTNKAIAMHEWCEKMKIRATPTFFINGKELPESYDFSDLKYFF
ncbi:vitamin K epoxide reductase family protein [Sphingobacterium sp. GVS05A]|uniref:vitamin K epoxide reductase family protein n=1 Tax=Sphingobacterium sp. GVS05A TaxID=2862679 RepID=UPI001CBC9523|nr:vitamin K epoxide reductase family protein [Sphingobacterium sp. GVS05A]